jgi:carboxymethylenebutenolidase
METITIKVSDGSEMRAYAARPEKAAGPDESPRKGIIVIQEAFGVNDYIKRMGARFTGQGYLAVVPEMFHRSAAAGQEFSYTDYPAVQPQMAALTLEGQLADMQACFDWLVSQGVPKDKIVVLGFCMGGRASFLANSAMPLAAAVSFYGGGLDTMLDRIPALHGPQLMMWGGKDDHIPPEKYRPVVDALQAAGKPFVNVVFSEAGHAFTRDVDPTHFHESSAKEAWALVDQFLADNVG